MVSRKSIMISVRKAFEIIDFIVKGCFYCEHVPGFCALIPRTLCAEYFCPLMPPYDIPGSNHPHFDLAIMIVELRDGMGCMEMLIHREFSGISFDWRLVWHFLSYA